TQNARPSQKTAATKIARLRVTTNHVEWKRSLAEPKAGGGVALDPVTRSAASRAAGGETSAPGQPRPDNVRASYAARPLSFDRPQASASAQAVLPHRALPAVRTVRRARQAPGSRMNEQVTCVYRAYDDGALVATGRLMLEGLPSVGEEVRLNGRLHVVRAVEYGGGEHVLELEPRHTQR